MRKSTLQRAGATMLALALVTPLGAGLATATEQAPEETVAADAPVGPADEVEPAEAIDPAAETTEPTEPVAAAETADAATEPTAGQAAPAEGTGVAPNLVSASCDDERPEADDLRIFSGPGSQTVSWSPAGPSRAAFGDMAVEGFHRDAWLGDLTCHGARWEVNVMPWDDLRVANWDTVTWEAFTPVDGGHHIDGLAPGDYAVTFRVTYVNPDGEILVERHSPLEVTVLSIDGTFEAITTSGSAPLRAQPGQRSAYSDVDGTFRPGPVDLYLVDPRGVSTLLATGEAPSHGNVNIGFTVPADLAPGEYYLMAVSSAGATITGRILSVEIAPGPVVLTEIGINVEYEPSRSWVPSGMWDALLTGLSVDGLDAEGDVVLDVDATWSYRLNGADPVSFRPAGGELAVPGLREGVNTIELIAEHGPVGTSTVVEVTVGSLADLLDELRDDSTLPGSQASPGQTSRFTAGAGFFAPDETVTLTAIPADAAAPASRAAARTARTAPSTRSGAIVLATGTAAADGSLALDVVLPADLALGTYYLVAEGASSHEVGFHRLSVVAGVPGSTVPAVTAPAAPSSTARTASKTAAAALATTGSEASTGLVAAGVLTAAGAAATIGAARLRRMRAARV